MTANATFVTNKKLRLTIFFFISILFFSNLDVSGECVLKIEIPIFTMIRAITIPTTSTEEDMIRMSNAPTQASGIAVIQTHLCQV